MIIWIIPAIIIVGILIWFIGIYNRLVRNKNMVEESDAQTLPFTIKDRLIYSFSRPFLSLCLPHD